MSIIQVNLTSAVRLLRKHSRFEKEGAIQQICFFCESFQTFLEQGLPNANAFIEVQRKVKDAIQTGTFNCSEQLEIIAGLLIGKTENYEKCARALFENWYEILPSYTLFTCPSANIENIGRVAQTLYNALCPKGVHVSVIESLVSDLDRPIFSLLSRNLVDTLKQICERSNLWWFPVHFIDLFYRYDSALIASLTEAFPVLQTSTRSRQSTILDENSQPLDHGISFSVHSAMLIDYGKALLNSRDYWTISGDYLR